MERRVFDLLLYLIRNRGRVIPKGELVRAIWANRVVSDASLSVAMTGVRRALGDNANAPRYIATHNARGYRFVPPVIEHSEHGFAVSTEMSTQSHDLFVGRKREISIVRNAAALSRTGHLQLVLISGEAGIGKTRLLDVATRELISDGYQSLVGRCPEAPGTPAFWPWTQILREHFDSSLPGGLGTAISGIEGVVHLLPELRRHAGALAVPTPQDPTQARFRMFDAISTCLDRAARKLPTVISLEDIHRADDASLLLLSFLVASLPTCPLLLLASYRDGLHTAAFSKTLASLVRASSTQCLSLDGLGYSETADLLSALVGTTANSDVTRELHERTRGNPYFLTHLARHVGTNQEVQRLALPSDLLAALASQIEDLSSGTRDLLIVAAVGGVDFSVPTLCEVLEISEPEALELLDEASQAGILVKDVAVAGFRFRHSLVRDALYQRIGPARRAVLHGAFARVLAGRNHGESGHQLSTIAHHYFEAAATGVAGEAIRYAIEAGQWSAACLAYEEAADFYQRAVGLLDLLPDTRQELRCELLVRVGDQFTKAGERGEARKAFERASNLAVTLGASRVLAEAALAAAPGLLALESGVLDPFLVELLGSALSSLPADEQALRARLLARLSLALHWSDDPMMTTNLAEHAKAIAPGTLDPESESSVKQALWFARHGPDYIADRVAIGIELQSIARSPVAPETQLVSQLFRLYSLLETGDIVSFQNEKDAYRVLAERLRQPQGLWYTGLLEGMSALLRGDFASAAEFAESFASLGRRANDANAVHSHLAHAALQIFERGDVRTAVPIAKEMAERFPSVVVWQAARTWMQALTGERQVSQQCLDRFVAAIPRLPRRMDWSGTLAMFAEAAYLLDDRAGAKHLYTTLMPQSESYVVLGLCTICWGSAARVLGLLAHCIGDLSQAESHLRRAIVLDEEIGARPWSAHGRMALARVLLAQGSDGGAIAVALEAEAIADDLGMINLARNARRFISSQTRA